MSALKALRSELRNKLIQKRLKKEQKDLKKEFEALMKEADNNLARGIEEDKKANYIEAVRHYTTGIQNMEDLCEMVKEEEATTEIKSVMNEYILRRRELTDNMMCFEDHRRSFSKLQPGTDEHKRALKYFEQFFQKDLKKTEEAQEFHEDLMNSGEDQDCKE